MKAMTRLHAEINDLAPDDLPIFTIEILGILALGTAFLLTVLDPMIGVVLLTVFAVGYVTVRAVLHNAER